MSDHQITLWDRAVAIAVTASDGRPVAKLYVERQDGETYVEIELARLVEMRATDRLITIRYLPNNRKGRKP